VLVDLYIYLPSVPDWHETGQPLPLPTNKTYKIFFNVSDLRLFTV